jgi:isoleucyl-tRNA synthetase
VVEWQAPAFGEDDYRVCLAHNIIEKGINVPCPVDANGRFTDEVPDFVGRHVKEVRFNGLHCGVGVGLSHRRET